MRFGPGYRVYYLHDGPRVILLLCGGDKATQQRDIERVYQLAEASSAPTPPSTPDCPKCNRTNPAPKGWTASS